MDERMRFVIPLRDGESIASLCREFGISRKTGYKIFERYEQGGLEGLSAHLLRSSGIVSGKSNLPGAVASFNVTCAGTGIPNGTNTPRYVLPTNCAPICGSIPLSRRERHPVRIKTYAYLLSVSWRKSSCLQIRRNIHL